MEIFLEINRRGKFPNKEQLVKAMWEQDVNISISTFNLPLWKCDTFTLSWDKWLDDRRWSGLVGSKVNINFYLESDEDLEDRQIKLAYKQMMIEVENPVLLVDKKAVYQAAILIADRCDGVISLNQRDWLSIDEFKQVVEETLGFTFKEAAEVSLKEAKRG
ncbi:hypothetical protein [Kroppenstedtia eburnea]|uniref:Uncharacterized protein n=1 Tax=Kroppenstedtia eburnea TaxID=714067 RepID=A0A1N7MWN4_9BACL|nr:hypothetical protein [Kroppenstedtia eburnea]QKI80699.1 hypothetical protein GXN75_00970 [Kroppenstedtia eburnea]SIS90428.1 hypothetical protein SAMN05421790_10796 [Kroppenstedtia eburnea]